jgi:hypothetical protein
MSISSLSFAQFEKGQLLADGQLSFANSKTVTNPDTIATNTTTNTLTSFSFTPSIGKFTSEHVMYGVGVEYNLYATTTQNAGTLSPDLEKYNHQSIGLRFYTRRYFPLAKNLYFYLDAAFIPAYTFNTENDSSTTNEHIKTNGVSLGAFLSTGVSYKLGSRWLANATLPTIVDIEYAHSKQTNTGSFPGQQTFSSFSVSSGLAGGLFDNITIGFSYLLHK